MMKQLWEESGKHLMSIQSLKESDLITTTTEKLCRTFKTFNHNVHIFKNMFDWNLPQWNLNKEVTRKEMLPENFFGEVNGNKKIIIGWVGLTSHFEDLKRMQPILKYIHDKYPHTCFMLAGMALKDTHVDIEETADGKKIFKEKEIADRSLTYRARVERLYEGIDKNRIVIYDALPLEEYAKFYALNDINLAYTEHNAFNDSKSPIKTVEGLHYGSIPVFSLYGGYRDLWNDIPKELKRDNIAIAMTSPSPWQRALEYWVEHMDEGFAYAAKLKSYVDNVYDINKNIENRALFLSEQIEKHDEQQTNNVARYLNYNESNH